MSKRIISLGAALVLLCAVSAGAADWGRIMTPKIPLNVRAGRSLDTARITTIMPGERVRVDFFEDGWCAVFRPNARERRQDKAMGYVNANYLVPADQWGEFRTPSGSLNVRGQRSLSSARVRTLKPGDVVRVDFERDGWVAVFDPLETVRSEKRAIGYSNSRYLVPATSQQIERALGGAAGAASESSDVSASPSPAAATASSTTTPPAVVAAPTVPPVISPSVPPTVAAPTAQSPAAEAAPEQRSEHWGRLVKLSRRVNLRAERTAGSKLVATLDPGQALRVDFLKRGWFAAFKPGETRRDESHALGYLYAALIENDLGPLPEDVSAERLPAPDVPVKAETAIPEAADEPLYQVRGTVRNEPPQELQQPESVGEASTGGASVDGSASSSPTAPAESAPSGTAAGEEDADSVVSPPTPLSVSGASGKASKPRLERMVVDPSRLPTGRKSPAPKADQTLHGFRYALMERQESREGRYPLDVLRVYLDVSVVPGDEALSDFCNSLWKQEWRQGTLMRIDVYLPDMDLRDLSYAEALFDGKGLRQFWARRTVLFGTRFKR